MYYDFNNTVRLSDDSSINDSRLNESSAGIYRPKRKRTLADYEFILNENSKFQTSELGKGAYGVVKKVKDKHTGKVYAMKIMSKKAIFEYSNKENLKREINIQKGILHPHIVRLYAYFEDTDNVYLILEYAENGSLFHYVRKKKKFLENEAFVYFFQTCLGIDYLHKRDIIHRDLKPENLLLDSEGNIKICDFGWSADINTKRHTFCGTVDYMAPEMVKNQPHDHRLDIWCLGVLLYEMLHGHAPFKGRSDQEKTNNISMNIPINFDHSLSQEVVDLIRRILQPAPVNRISMQGIFEHPWIKKAEKIYQIDVMSYVRHQDEQIKEIKRADFNKSMTLNQSYSNTDVTDRGETGIQQPNPTTRNYGSSDRLPIAHKYSNSTSSLNTSNNSYSNYNNNNAKIIRIQDHSTPLTLAQKINYEEPKKLSSYSRSTKASESSSIGSGNGSNTLTIEQLLRDHGARPQEKPQEVLMPRRVNTESSKSQQFTSSYITELMKQNSVSYPHRTEEDQREAHYTGKYNFDRYEVRRDTADGHTNTVYPSAQKQKSVQYEGSYFRDVNMHTSERRERQPQTQYQQQYHQLPSYREKRVEARANTPDKLSRSDVGNRSNYEKLYTKSGPLIREEKDELEDFQRVSRVSARNVEIFKLQRPSTKMQKDAGLFEKLLMGIGCISRETGNQIGKRNGK